MTFVLKNPSVRGNDLGVAEVMDSFIPGCEEPCASARLVSPYERLQYMISVTYYGGVTYPDQISSGKSSSIFSSMVAYAFNPLPSPAVQPNITEVREYTKMTRAVHYGNMFTARLKQSLKR